jgi:hypothetical protein
MRPSTAHTNKDDLMLRNGLLGMLSLMFFTSAWADVPDQRARIAELAIKVNAAAARQSDPAALAEARQLMRRALRRLRHGAQQTDRNRSECVRFATSIYAKNLAERTALERAIKRCKAPVDHRLLQFAYGIYAKNLQPRVALDRAFPIGQDEALQRRLPMLTFATDIYAQNLQARVALDRAIRFVKALPRHHESCVRTAYPTYRKSLQARVAIERAAQTCGR